MRNFAGTFVAAAVVAGLAAYAYFGEYKGGIEKEAQKAKSAAVLQLEKEKINHLEIVRKSGSVIIEKTDGVWRILEPVKDTADEKTATLFINTALSEKSQETVIEGDAINWATFGLDQPVTRLIVKTSDGKTQEIKIGAIKSFDGQLYARRDEDKAVLLVSTSWDPLLSKPVIDFRDKRLLRSITNDFDGFTIESRGKGGAKTIEMKTVDGKWEFVKGGDSSFPVDGTKVLDFLDRVKTLQAQEFVVEGKLAGELKKYGLTDPPLKITIHKSDKPPVALSFASASSKEGLRNATSTDVDAITQLSASTVAEADLEANAFFDLGFPFKVVASDIHGVTINAAGVDLQANKAGDKWTLAKPIEGKELDQDLLQNIVSRVSAWRATKVLGKGDGKGIRDGKNEIRLLNEKGQPLMKINWGDLFTENAAKAAEPGKGDDANAVSKQYYIKTSRVERVLAVASPEIDDLGLAGLLKVKPAVAPVEAKSTK